MLVGWRIQGSPTYVILSDSSFSLLVLDIESSDKIREQSCARPVSQFGFYPEGATLTLEPFSAWESRHQLIPTIDCEDSSVLVLSAIVVYDELGGSSNMMNRP